MRTASIVESFKNASDSFVRDETGATAIEYGLIAGLVSIAIIAAVTTLGTDLSSLFTTLGTKINTAKGSG